MKKSLGKKQDVLLRVFLLGNYFKSMETPLSGEPK